MKRVDYAYIDSRATIKCNKGIHGRKYEKVVNTSLRSALELIVKNRFGYISLLLKSNIVTILISQRYLYGDWKKF